MLQAVGISAPSWGRFAKVKVALGTAVLIGVSLFNHKPLIAAFLAAFCLAGFGITCLWNREGQDQSGKRESHILSVEPLLSEDNEAVIVVLDFENEKLAKNLTCITQGDLSALNMGSDYQRNCAA